jgi:hypothetical protein
VGTCSRHVIITNYRTLCATSVTDRPPVAPRPYAPCGLTVAKSSSRSNYISPAAHLSSLYSHLRSFLTALRLYLRSSRPPLCFCGTLRSYRCQASVNGRRRAGTSLKPSSRRAFSARAATPPVAKGLRDASPLRPPYSTATTSFCTTPMPHRSPTPPSTPTTAPST